MRSSRRWTWAHRATAAACLALFVLSRDPSRTWLTGNYSAARLLDRLPLADPLAALEVWLASGHLGRDLAIGAGIVAVFYALLGRVFCGWICPLGLLLDLAQDVRARLFGPRHSTSLRLADEAVPTETRYFVLAAVLLGSAIGGVPLFTTVSPINALMWLAVFGVGVEVLLPAALIVLEFFAPRVFCRALCPLGAMYSLIGRFGLLRVRVLGMGGLCVHCRKCSVACPMGIDVMEDWVVPGHATVDDAGCTRCGTCLDGCPTAALTLRATPSHDRQDVHTRLSGPRKRNALGVEHAAILEADVAEENLGDDAGV